MLATRRQISMFVLIGTVIFTRLIIDLIKIYTKDGLEQLEEIGNSFDGVEKTFAVQAGRELRVVVKPEEVDDLGAHKIAREVKEQIEANMKYPGTIKITVVRETRAQEEAK